MLLSALALAAFMPASASAASAPEVRAFWSSEVAATSARLHGEINSEEQPTTYHFEYISASAYEGNIAAGKDGFVGASKAPAGPEAKVGPEVVFTSVFQQVGGLAAETSYRYRLVAKNASGTTIGSTLGFNTENVGGGTLLLDERGWEMVSPIEKNGGQIQGAGEIRGGGVLQAAANGESVTYSSTASFDPEAQGAPVASQYISSRSAGGWLTQNITVPTVTGAYGDSPNGVPYQIFSSELSLGLLLNGRRCGEAEPCPRQYSLRVNATGGLTGSPAAPDLRIAGASPDLRHVVLSTCRALTPEATEVAAVEGCDPAQGNLYDWSEGQLRLINLLPGESEGTPGAMLGAQAGAVSDDGSRIYFADQGSLYLRKGSTSTLVAESGAFQTATPSGAFAFFIRESHLYRYAGGSAETLDLTPGGGAEGVLGISDDGSRAYYGSSGGRVFLWDHGTTREVATKGSPSDYPPAIGTARVSADGTRLVFLSKASLTGYDNTDQVTHEADSEVFLYDLAQGLSCISCNPTEERPLGPSTIPGATANGTGPTAVRAYKPRALAEPEARVVFESGDALVLQDTNHAPDVYEWEAQGEGSCLQPDGCLSLVSSGRVAGGASFVDASASGSDVFFLTEGSLVPSDSGSVDLYDARAGGGFPIPPSAISCEADTCQALPSEPEDPEPSTLRSGPGNPPVRFGKPRHHRHHHHHPRQRKHRHKRGHK